MSQYVHQAWGPEQGYLAGTVYAVGRSTDGYLWIGTDRGLVRYDSNGFELIRQPIPGMPPIGRVRGLVNDAQGTLWVLLEGAHMLVYRDGQFSDAYASFHLPEVIVTAIALDRNNDILLSGFGKVFARSNGRVQVIADTTAVQGTIISIAQTQDGRIWLGTQDDGLFIAEHGQVSKVPQTIGNNKINALAAAFNGGMWIGTDQGIYFLTPQGELDDPLPKWTHQHQVLRLYRDRDSCVWAGTDKGLIRITSGGNAALRQGARAGAVNTVFQDREGNLWFGGAGGLERLQDGVFFTYSAGEGIPAAAMGPVFADDLGGIWFAPLSGGLYLYQGDRLQQVREDGLDRDVIYSIDGAAGSVWVGRQNGGLTRIRRDGDRLTAQTFTEKNGLAQDTVYTVHVSPNGTAWAGSVSGGVSVFTGSNVKTYTTGNGLSSNTIASIIESREGRVWIATPNGLDEFRAGRWVHWTTSDGLPSADIKLSFVDSKGVIWVATANGLAYISNDHVTALPDLPNVIRESILGIVEDQLGFLWFSTSDQMLRVNRAALLSGTLRPGDLQTYGMADGLAGIEPLGRARSMVVDNGGRIWVSLIEGIACGEPRLTDRDSMPVQVRLDSVAANGKGFAPGELSRIPAGTRSMSFQYSGDSLFAPERVRYRYRLEGTEAEWSDVVATRQVLYNNLSPGDYHLHVIASRDGALWNGSEMVYSFSIDPTYWQTWWFRSAVALAVLLSLLVLVRLRSARLARQLNARFQERLSERTRIAQELHDTLLQSFQGLMLRFQTVANLLPGRPVEAKSVLEKALDRADSALAESRDAIQNIRSAASKCTDLAKAINGMMAELAEEHARTGIVEVSRTVVVVGTPRSLHPWVNAEVLRIAQECLRNAFQHSGATSIEVEVKFEASHLGIRFLDNGVGIDAEVLKHGSRLGHWGLIGMKERASQIGAKLEVWSKPSAGTELDLIIPANIAFDRTQNKGGFRALRKRLGKSL